MTPDDIYVEVLTKGRVCVRVDADGALSIEDIRLAREMLDRQTEYLAMSEYCDPTNYNVTGLYEFQTFEIHEPKLKPAPDKAWYRQFEKKRRPR